MTGPTAKAAEVTYLEEGTHNFTFEDRFNVISQINQTIKAKNPIPLGIDIVMTHGPPYSIFGQADGKDSHRSGCPQLLHAVSRTRPLMYCFGYIHEGDSARMVTWRLDGAIMKLGLPMAVPLKIEHPESNEWWGEQSVLRPDIATQLRIRLRDKLRDNYHDSNEMVGKTKAENSRCCDAVGEYIS